MKTIPFISASTISALALVGGAYLAMSQPNVPTAPAVNAQELHALQNELNAKANRLDQLIAEQEQRQAAAYDLSRLLPAGDSDSQIQALAQALVATQSELAALRLDLQDQQALAQPPAIQLSEAEIQSRQQLTQQAQQTLLEQTLYSEGVDPEWSPQATSQVRNRLGNTQDITLGELECASSMCMLTASATNHDQAFQTLSETLAWEGEMYVNVSAEGEMLAYLARPGSSLPRAKQP